MTPPRELAAGQAGPAVILANDTCTDVLSQVIADAFFDLAVSRWLIPDAAARREIFPGYFRLSLEHALADGIVCTTPGQDAVALWLPAGEEPAPPPDGYDERLAAVTGPWAYRFRIFDQTLDRRHPTGFAHHHLAILAVHPDRQGQGTGSVLLRAHHAALDRDGVPAYLEASDLRSRRLYLAHGYAARSGPIFLPGALMHPMVRQPGAGEQAGGDHHRQAHRERRAGTGARRCPVRYRDLDRIDLDAAKEKVREWMLAHPGGTPGQMAADLEGGYAEFAEHMAIVLHGIMAAFQDHPGELDPGGTSGETG